MPGALSTRSSELSIRVEEAFRSLDLPEACTVSRLLDRVSLLSGRAVAVDPCGNDAWGSLTGLVIIDAEKARILVRKSDPYWYQLHVVLHEVGHLVLDHVACTSHPGSPRRGTQVLARSVASPRFAESGDYSDRQWVQEAEAEMLAHRLAAHMLRGPSARDEAVYG